MNRLRHLAAVAAGLVLAAGLAASPAAHAGGKVIVINETDVVIKPWYKFPGDLAWRDFGGIGPRSQFQWDFNGVDFPFGKTRFTYTVVGAPPPVDPVDRDLRARFRLDATHNAVIQIGDSISRHDLSAPGEVQEDDDDDDDNHGKGDGKRDKDDKKGKSGKR